MSGVRPALFLGVLAFVVAVVVAAKPAHAQSIDLAGAWATDADQCTKVFSKTDKGVTFTDLSELYGSGFIVDQNRIIGKTAHCRIVSRKQDGDMLHLMTSCATEIMLSRIQFSLKVVDGNNIIRFFPGLPELSMNYQRCAL